MLILLSFYLFYATMFGVVVHEVGVEGTSALYAVVVAVVTIFRGVSASISVLVVDDDECVTVGATVCVVVEVVDRGVAATGVDDAYFVYASCPSGVQSLSVSRYPGI